MQSENLNEIKTSLTKEMMSDLAKMLAENQKETLKLIATINKKQQVHLNNHDSDSEPENISVARTSTPVKTTTATNSKTTPVNSRNTCNSDISANWKISANPRHSQNYVLHKYNNRILYLVSPPHGRARINMKQGLKTIMSTSFALNFQSNENFDIEKTFHLLH